MSELKIPMSERERGERHGVSRTVGRCGGIARAVRGVVLAGLVALMAAYGIGCSSQDISTQAPTPEEEEKSDLTLAEQDEKCRNDLIAHLNKEDCVVTQMGYSLDSEAELESLKFYDIYVASGEEKNTNFNLVIRYEFQLDGLDSKSLADRCYMIDNYTYSFFRENSYSIKDIGALIDFLYENKEDITFKQNSISFRMNETDDERSQGSYLHFNAEDLQEYLNGLEPETEK